MKNAAKVTKIALIGLSALVLANCGKDESSTSAGSSSGVLQVLGQYLFETSTSAATDATLNAPGASVYDSTKNRLFVVDSGNNRVLVFNTKSLSDGDSAVYVLGQANFTASATGSTAATLSAPSAVAFDATRNYLYVSDTGNNRILVFDVASITNGEAAIHVLGQPDFTTVTTGLTSITLNTPVGVSYDSSTQFLFVADQGNHRVLAYNLVVIVDGEAAVKVLGQADYTSNSTGTTSTTLDGPYGVAADSSGQQLFVSDMNNSRVLVYSTAAISNGDAAVNVLGQADFTSNSTGTTATTMNLPKGLAYDSSGSRLFVGDYTNNRILVYNLSSITDGEAAVRVLGQAALTTGTAGTTSTTARQPLGLCYDSTNERLFVADSGNNRLLIYDVDIILTGEAAVNELGQSSFTSKSASATARGLSSAQGVSLDVENHRLFVADTGNNRVLIYDTSVTSNGAAAVNVLGQSSFTGSASGSTSTTLNAPTSLFYDSANELLYVADSGNNRVLVYDVSFPNDGDAAIKVLGQTNFTNNSAATTAAGLDTPIEVVLDSSGNRLFVSDSGNNRVLVYDVAAIANGESAVNVLGQVNFTTATNGNTAATLDTPMGVNYDSTDDRLFVADSVNNRVLVYNVASITNGENAVNVVGQANLTSNSAGTTATTLDVPVGVYYDSAKSRLFVSDGDNNRVLLYTGMSEAAISNGNAASKVFGQSDYTTGTAGVTSSTLDGPSGLTYDAAGNRLYVTDTTNNRLLIFQVY